MRFIHGQRCSYRFFPALLTILFCILAFLGCKNHDKGGGNDTFDIDTAGIPQFVGTDYIELNKITRISKFRSSEGHDYSDDFESCRSMKHYFVPMESVDWAAVKIFSPVSGTIERVEEEWAGTQVRIKAKDYPAFYFIIFHVNPAQPLAVGDSVSAGQQLGTHIGSQTYSGIAIGVNTPKGWKLVSYFDVMTDSLFETYQASGLNSRADVIISKEARDADPLTCIQWQDFTSFGSIENFVSINIPAFSISIEEFTVPSAGFPILPNVPLTNSICIDNPADPRCTDCSVTPERCSSYPRAIAAGPDGNLWFTEECGNKIGRITPDGVITEFPHPDDPWQLKPYDCAVSGVGKGLHSITAGADGNLWFADSVNNTIWKMNTDGVIAGEYPVDSCTEFTGFGPHGITAGPDRTIWFAHLDCNYIGKIATETGEMTGKYVIPTDASGTAHITAGPGNTIWFTEHGATGSVNKIGKITPDGAITEYPAEGDATTLNVPFEITAGNDGNVWFTERAGNSIGQITPEGIITKFPLPGDPASVKTPIGITAGPDNTIWFTEGGSSTIGQISAGGAITKFPILSGASGWHITLGPDNNIWFTELTGNRIGKVKLYAK